jgi:low temperature requirement protein LtrA
VSPQAESPLPEEPGRQPWWQTPRLRSDEDRQEERKVTWLELFFDLVFVVAISQLASELAHDITWVAAGTFALLFMAVWWIWIGATFYNERFETTGLENRLLFFILMLPTAGLALYAPDGLGASYTGFAISYAIARAVTTFSWARAGYHVPRYRPIATRFTVGFTISISIVLASIAAEGTWRIAMLVAALLIDVGTPTLTTRHNEMLPKFSTRKLPERFGLFTMIVIGESVISAVRGIAGGTDPDVTSAAAGGFGIAIGFCLWWVYFDYIARRPPRQTTFWTFSWAYLHLPLMMAIAAAGAAVLGVVSRAENAVPENARWLLAGALAMALIAVAAIERTLQREHDEPTHSTTSAVLKLAGAAAALALVPLGAAVTSLWFLGALLVPLLVLMGYSAWVWYRGTRG